jgi:ferredoxin
MIARFKGFASHAAALPNETILDVARRAAIPLGNSCGAVGICGRCRVQVLSGAENLSPPTSVESRFGKAQGFLDDERMACQAVLQGDCEVTTSYW